MRNSCLKMGLAIGWLAAAVGALQADVIFSNITSGNSGLEAALGASVPVRGPQSVGAEFTPTTNSTMSEVQVKAQGAGGDPHFNLYLYSDSSGAPGTSLETLGTDLTPNLFPTPAAIVNLSSFPALPLTGGAHYWLVMTPFGQISQVGWATGGSPFAQTDLSPTSDGSGSWSALASGSTTSVQFEIDGSNASSVPEPAMGGLLAAGLGLSALASQIARRRRQRANSKQAGL